ncbi:MAG: Acetylspermidine deacetylase; Deacetylases, including yeast histone deacetylase and acetoin utilization protein [uncultured Solirubrobacterales bacterium]|uniref:Acetylspermidine deacetylase Deacetylases, including yeast histone deacetylase and acetoin utilization protein n=1 Tax=uncultured Solirubrobacterales bacterium TaxID=768556 RepID=A0A6J4S114_9ACTN|nr:MAG: Acetylspermidine deacetylase; Deacetylases, including yeast histone deacetylase and acetoin utilization protein [uncultured Solirubrobacterales bacterium]
MGSPLLFRHPSSLEHETGAHPEGSGRIEAIEAELAARDWLGWEPREAPAVDLGVLRAVHPDAHIEAVRAVSQRGGGAFDPDTVASAGSYVAALHAAGGACAMAEALLAGDAGAGFCALRPPGHHAEPAQAMGFCLFNNVAVAARHALDSLGARRVFVLDWDVHHGNGTNDIFHASDELLFASIHQSPLYPGTGPLSDTGSGRGEGYTINLPVAPGSGEQSWLALVEHVVAPAAAAFEPDLVLASAGFDAHRADPLATCRLETSSFGELARHARAIADAAGAPVGAVLEGGYDVDALAASVAATLEGLAEGGAPRAVEPDAATERARQAVGRFWALA